MDYQETFYLLGSIYMFLGIILTLILIGGSIFIIFKVKEIHKEVSERTKNITSNIREMKQELTDNPGIIVRYVGQFIAKGISNKFKELMGRSTKT